MFTYQYPLVCPFCGFEGAEYVMLVHMESNHREGFDSSASQSFVSSSYPHSKRSSEIEFWPNFDDSESVFLCSYPNCGLSLDMTSMEHHLQLHEEQEALFVEESDTSHTDHRNCSPDRQSYSHGSDDSSLGESLKNKLRYTTSAQTSVCNCAMGRHSRRHSHSSKDREENCDYGPDAKPRDRSLQDRACCEKKLDHSHKHHRHRDEKRKSRTDHAEKSKEHQQGSRHRRERAKSHSHSRSRHLEDKERSRRHSPHCDRHEEPRAMRIVRQIFSNNSSSSHSPRRHNSLSSRKGEPKTPSSTPVLTTPSPGPSTAKSEVRRLGISELGLFAYEKRMPGWLKSLLERRGTTALPGMIPSLAWHIDYNKSTSFAYLAHPGVQQVFKLRREGHFCGYRNIQTMASFVNAALCLGNEAFGGKLPTIFEIQDLIEKAWDAGINSHGREETGGIRNTRKYIGTSEAEALFSFVGTPCSVRGFRDHSRTKASQNLLDWFLEYFSQNSNDLTRKVRFTDMPPVYLQNPRHSMVVIGIEKEVNGDLNLLVFDPKYHDDQDFTYLINKHSERATTEILSLYRRGIRYLGRHDQFEVLYFRHAELDIGKHPARGEIK